MSDIRSCLLCGSRDNDLNETIYGNDICALYNEMDVFNLNLPEKIFFMVCNRCGLKWFSPTITGDPFFYERLQRHKWYYQNDKLEFTSVSNELLNCRSVLEVGCGAGYFSKYIHPDSRYVGLEFNEAAIRSAREKGLDVRKQTIQDYCAGANDLVDVVASFQVLEHVSDPAGFLDACSNALKPDGKLVISVPNEDSFLGVVTNSCLNLPPHHVTRWTEKAFLYWSIHNNFEVEKTIFESVAPYHLIWWRKTRILEIIRYIFGISHRQVDLSYSWLFISKLAALFARMLPFKGGNNLGHSITVVLRKKQ